MFCRNCGKDVVATAEFCPNCGAKPTTGRSFCSSCGAQVSAAAEICMKCGTRLTYAAPTSVGVVTGGVSSKSRLVTLLLLLFLGFFGVHRFYVGKIGTGILIIVLTLCFGVSSIWLLIDLIMLLIGKFKDKNGAVVLNWGSN
jgi:TM2 domain-containing membrane protein YozV